MNNPSKKMSLFFDFDLSNKGRRVKIFLKVGSPREVLAKYAMQVMHSSIAALAPVILNTK